MARFRLSHSRFRRQGALAVFGLSLLAALGAGGRASGAPLGVTLSNLGGGFEVPYVLVSEPGNDVLRISVGVRIQRNQPLALPANVTVRYRATLTEESGDGSHSVQTSFTTSHLVSGVFDQVVNDSFTLDPGAVLADDVNHTLLLEVFHIEDPASPTFTFGDSDSQSVHLGYFSGVISFGRIDATLLGFGALPQFLGSGRWDIDAADGTLPGGAHHFENNAVAPPALRVLRDPATGDLSVLSGSAEVIHDGDPFPWGDWLAELGPVLISRLGIVAQTLTLQLPPGIGWRSGTGGALSTTFSAKAAIPLDADLMLADPDGPFGGPVAPGREFIGDCLAVAFTPDAWSFDGQRLVLSNPGTRFLRHARYQQHVDRTGTLPPSNDAYLFYLGASAASDLVLDPGIDGGMTVDLPLATGTFTTHFPEATIRGQGGVVRVARNAVDPMGSSFAALTVELEYEQGCPNEQEGGPDSPTKQRMRMASPTIGFTPQGGLTASGPLATPAEVPGVERRLVIGLNEAIPVHETDDFAEATFYAPGPVVPRQDGIDRDDDANNAVDEAGEWPEEFNPARFLLTGMHPADAFALEHPGTAGYEAGLGDYAGFNFVHFAGLEARSWIGGALTPAYALLPNAKFYARCSGVSGILEADPAALPFDVAAYGFDIGLTDWGFNVLSNRMLESYIDGQVDLSATPAGFVQAMESLRISCCGNLEGFDLPPGENAKRLAYWQDSEIRNASARFVTPGAFDALKECDASAACLRYASTATINGLPGDKAGFLCFLNTGTLTNPSTPDFDPSVLALEPQDGFHGRYRFEPVADAHFSNPFADGPAVPGFPGFVALSGLVDVAFFDGIPVLAHTAAIPEVDDEVIVGFVHGPFLGSGEIDALHAGLPAGSTPDDYAGNPARRPHAVGNFFGKEGGLDFEVVFDRPTGNFHTVEPKGIDILIVETESTVERLNDELAHLRFGGQIEGLVQLSLGNLLEEALDYGAQGVADAIGEEVTEPIKEGLLGLAETLDNRLEALVDDALRTVVSQLVAVPLVDKLRQLEVSTPDWVAADLDVTLGLYLAPGGPLEDALEGFARVDSVVGDIKGVADEVQVRLDRIGNALDCLIILTGGLPDGGAFPAHEGLSNLFDFIVEELELNSAVGELDDQTVTEAFDALIASADAELGWLKDARTALMEIRAVVDEAAMALETGQEFFEEIDAVFKSVGAMANVVLGARLDLRARLLEVAPGQILDFSVPELEEMVVSTIRNRLLDSLPTANLQSILRARLGYLDSLLQETIASALQAINRAIIDAVEESGLLEALELPANEVLGFLSLIDTIGLHGEAVVRGDRISELILQSEAKFSFPSTPPVPMSLDAVFRYSALESDGSGACTAPRGEIMPEVTFTASGGTAVGMGQDSRVDAGLKFAFSPTFVPNGIGGFIHVKQSRYASAGVGMDEISAAFSAGGPGEAKEFYIAAWGNGRMGAGSVELEGGIFLGQTCSPDPLAFYPSALSPPAFIAISDADPISGIVGYFSGKAPIIGGSCLFNVTVGAGIGGYVLTGGIGGLLEGSVSGEVLCLAKAEGEISLLYDYGAGTHVFTGQANVAAKLGFEPFAIEVSKSVDAIYVKPPEADGEWQVSP